MAATFWANLINPNRFETNSLTGIINFKRELPLIVVPEWVLIFCKEISFLASAQFHYV